MDVRETAPRAVRHGIIASRPRDLFGYFGWPSVCADENGVLYAVCSGGRMLHVCPFGKTYLYRSADGGRTWSAPVLVNDTALDDRDAGILAWNGALLASWFCHPAEVYLNEYKAYMLNETTGAARAVVEGMMRHWAETAPTGAGSFLRRSDDGGWTWGETVCVPVSAPHGPSALPDGSLIYVGKAMYTDALHKDTVAVYHSRDGADWTCRCAQLLPDDMDARCFHEPHTLALPDGSLLCAIRAQGKNIPDGGFTIYTARSADGGCTWTRPEPAGFRGAPPHLLRHSSGAVICTFGRRSAPYGQRARVSYDEGRTWPVEYVLRDDGVDVDLGYPCTAELPDGSLCTVYYQKSAQQQPCDLMYTVWSL